MTTFDAPAIPELLVLLEDQSGVVSVAQLARLCVSREFPRARVRADRWRRLHDGVYAAFSGPVSRDAEIWAAILRCGPGAVASHQTAAELDLISDDASDPIHVTVDASRRVKGRLAGIRVHYAHRLAQSRHPAKTPPRTRVEDTVLDLVDVSRSAGEAAGWIIPAIQRRLTTPSRMAVERAHALPTGERQRRVAGQRVIWIDVDYGEFTTRVELDGRVGHVDEGVFRDRQRDNHATRGGKSTLRYGFHDVFGAPCAVAAEQAVVLQDRGWSGTPEECGPDCQIEAVMARMRNAA